MLRIGLMMIVLGGVFGCNKYGKDCKECSAKCDSMLQEMKSEGAGDLKATAFIMDCLKECHEHYGSAKCTE